VTNHLQHASARQRVAAFAWDYVLIASYVVLLSLVSTIAWFGLLGRVPVEAQRSPWLYDLLAFTTLMLPVILYFGLCEASSAQATWGKRRVGLVVVSSRGDRLSIGRSLMRSGLKFLPWQIAHTCLFHIPGWPAAPGPIPTLVMGGLALAYGLVGLYLVGLVIPPAHRTAYDWVAGTRVVTAASPRWKLP
jgi:uncharacterized RDD family membrane protein YckC